MTNGNNLATLQKYLRVFTQKSNIQIGTKSLLFSYMVLIFDKNSQHQNRIKIFRNDYLLTYSF